MTHSQQKYLYFTSLAILLTGLASAVTIYLTAADESGSDLIHEFENSKRYRHDLEAYGGKASVLADEFSRWFAGLWQGRQLGVTICCISIAISLGLFVIARHSADDSSSDGAK